MNKEYLQHEKEARTKDADTQIHAKKHTKKLDFTKFIKPGEVRMLITLLVFASVLLNVYFLGMMFSSQNERGGLWRTGGWHPHKTRKFTHHKNGIKTYDTDEYNFSFVYCDNDYCKRYDKSGEHAISKEEALRIQKQMEQEFQRTQKEIQKQFDEMERWHEKMMRDLW